MSSLTLMVAASFFSLILSFVCRGGIVSHSFELEAKVKGPFYGAPALVTFRVPSKAVLQVLPFIYKLSLCASF